MHLKNLVILVNTLVQDDSTDRITNRRDPDQKHYIWPAWTPWKLEAGRGGHAKHTENQSAT